MFFTINPLFYPQTQGFISCDRDQQWRGKTVREGTVSRTYILSFPNLFWLRQLSKEPVYLVLGRRGQRWRVRPLFNNSFSTWSPMQAVTLHVSGIRALLQLSNTFYFIFYFDTLSFNVERTKTTKTKLRTTRVKTSRSTMKKTTILSRSKRVKKTLRWLKRNSKCS